MEEYMDKAFDKFGIYDFFGIWIPGALTVTYYLFTLRDFFYHFFELFGIKQNGLSGDFLIIILYTAVAYFAGVILHEAGKIIADFTKCFNFSSINSRCNLAISERPKFFHIFKRIKFEYKHTLNDNGINIDTLNSFDKAISCLKFGKNINTKRIDTYHSVYALSRSLCLCFLGHIILYSVYAIWACCGNWSVKPNLWLIIFDIIAIALFFIRTYRYFHTWVKNVYLQYQHELSSVQNSENK